MTKAVCNVLNKYVKCVKNKSSPEDGGKINHDKGHNCSCVIKAPLLQFLRLVEKNLQVEGEFVLAKMPTLMKGYCKKLTFQHLLNMYIRVNNLVSPRSNQHRIMDSVMKECFEGLIPADKLYIKLPVESKSKEIILGKVVHQPMKDLVKRIGVIKESTQDTYVVNFNNSIQSGQCTKEEYLKALPFVTDICRKELMALFHPPVEKAKLKMNMVEAFRCDMVERLLNTVELAYMAKPDFDSQYYPVFFANFLTTPNLDTNSDLHSLHKHSVLDRAMENLTTLKSQEVMESMDWELKYIKDIWSKSKPFKSAKRKCAGAKMNT